MTQRQVPAPSATPAATRAAAAPTSPARADAVGPPAPPRPEADARGLTATARAALAELPPCLAALGHLFTRAGHEIALVGGPVRDAFLGVVSGRAPVPATIDDALASLRIAIACGTSLREGRPVRVS